MNFFKIIAPKSVISGLIFLLSLSVQAQTGQQIFQQNCATCHALDKVITGPALRGVESRGPWTNRANLHKWVHSPAAFYPSNPYTADLVKTYNQVMPNQSVSDADIDKIFDYIKAAPTAPTGGGNGGASAQPGGEPANYNLLFGIISLVLALIALILMQVNSSLKKLSDDKDNIQRPDPVPFYRNKIYIALLAIVLFMIGGYFLSKEAIGLGRQQGYQPEQPIYYSHKIHAGINQINCLYCHGGAMESKHAGIPSLNICMNCHKAISSYEKGPKILDEAGNQIDGTAEIQKLYKYAGFTPGPGAQWDPSKAKSPEWVKIHNLPDHVYFSHAQHVNAGKVQCQSCHGNIQEMDRVKQVAELSMGWCVNCHRETKVNFNYTDSTGNKFYSIYEKFHNDLKSGKMDSITVKDIGGLECQKCHY